ncbi:MAG: di-trans,poly-cis-decaprenylcistransferase [Firmicutes bacterium]|nr:di-trans,poly-cis-decaprenylcistransferase [Bacillota bacterium]
MDGNGRWARRRGLPRFLGHQQGVKALKKAVRFASDQGIQSLTVYAFSTENWQRPKEEVSFLLDLMHKTFVEEIDELHQEGVRIVLVGDRSNLSADILQLWQNAEGLTQDNTGLTLNVAFNYGGRQELLHVAKVLAQRAAVGDLDPAQIDESMVNDLLYTKGSPDPDLIIRTGGEQRLSNFLLWQSAYSELYVTDVLWPDFNEEHFASALDDFGQRERRFGRVGKKE